jgi:hypothetical protein
MQLAKASNIPKPNHITCIVGALSDGSGWRLMNEIIAAAILIDGMRSISFLKPLEWKIDQ